MMEILIDPARPGDFNQALMDLGSDIESPVNPRPEESPVKEFSAAYQHGTMDRYPIKALRRNLYLSISQPLLSRIVRPLFVGEK